MCLLQARWGGKKLNEDAEATTTNVRDETKPSHLAYCLFPEAIANHVQGPVALMQHYYGYYRDAIRDALYRPSRTPFPCGGLQGYDQLVGIDQHLSQQRLQGRFDPYLNQLHGYVQRAVQATTSQAQGVRQALACLTAMDHYLAEAPCPSLEAKPQEIDLSSSGSETVQRELEQMVSDWTQQPKVYPLTRRLVRKWTTMSKTWLPGILQCYDVPGLPRSNLDLESIFGTLRRGQRRISGRKETMPIRVFGPGQIALLSLDDTEILPLLRSAPVDAYWFQRRRQAEREEPRRWRIRLHRDPGRALTQVDEQFYAVVKAGIRTSDRITGDP